MWHAGMMGSGKTTVGKVLSGELGYSFVAGLFDDCLSVVGFLGKIVLPLNISGLNDERTKEHVLEEKNYFALYGWIPYFQSFIYNI